MDAQRFIWSWVAALLAGAHLLASGCIDNRSSNESASTLNTTPAVTDTASASVVGATVYLVPASDVASLAQNAITASNVLNGEAENFDEPLEDLIRSPASATYPQAVTDARGTFRIPEDQIPDGSYFVYVQPAPDDTRHLPGGDLSRVARTKAELLGSDTELSLDIRVSTTPSPAASYLGSSACVICHPDQGHQLGQTLHRLGLQVPGQPNEQDGIVLQDLSQFGQDAGDPPGAQWFNKALETKFLDGDVTAGGTLIYYSAYDESRDIDKFVTSESPGADDVVSVRVFRDTLDAKFKVQITNLVNSNDPLSGAIYEVVLTYGGGLYKQHYLTRIGQSTYLLPVQFQHEGDEASADRTRRVWFDYHMDRWGGFADVSDVSSFLLESPAVDHSFDANCGACHLTGYTLESAANGEWQAHAVADPAGAFDFDGDGRLEEINIGCEMCHGPGSEHVNIGGAGIAIVSPENLSPGRANMLCGRCHDRRLNAASVSNDQPLNVNDQLAPPGISRQAFLPEFASLRAGPSLEDVWPDELHSKSHYQEYADLIKSRKYRNSSELLTCMSCHDAHGFVESAEGQFVTHQLILPVDDDSLCNSCHTEAIGDLPAITDKGLHTQQVVGFNHVRGGGGRVDPSCVNCHSAKTAKSGAGREGRSTSMGGVGMPSVGDGEQFYENDIGSHIFDVPRKTNPGVFRDDGEGSMPIPYTRNGEGCLGCHDLNSLPNTAP